MKRRTALLLTAVIVSVLCLVGCSTGGDAVYTGELTADKLMDVRETAREGNICIEVKLYERTPFGLFSYSKSRSLGSGVIYKLADGYYYAVTNWHVVEYDGYARAEYFVTTFGGRVVEGEVVKSDETKDLAILRFEAGEDVGENALRLIDVSARLDKPLVRGEMLFAVGNPSGVKNIVTYGVFVGMAKISAVDFNVIHHNALINKGNSGGALCDIDGNLVGINTWAATGTDDNNYSVPLEVVAAYIA